MSGTPLMNGADDIYPLFRFLRYQPFAAWYGLADIASHVIQRILYPRCLTDEASHVPV